MGHLPTPGNICLDHGVRSGSGCCSRSHFMDSYDEPSPLVNIEFHQALVSHFQQQGLAGFLIHDIGPFHDLVDFERLLAERAEDIFSIIQHDLVTLQKRGLLRPMQLPRAFVHWDRESRPTASVFEGVIHSCPSRQYFAVTSGLESDNR
jgi:hypothetical protein